MKRGTVILLTALCLVLSAVGCAAPFVPPFVMNWTRVGTSGAPAFENGWSNVYASDQLLSYAIDDQGFLHIDGAISDGSPSTSSSIVFTLPAGFRPASIRHAAAIGLSMPNLVPVMVTVESTGTVTVGASGLTLDVVMIGNLTVRMN